jgi:hypothetical protein
MKIRDRLSGWRLVVGLLALAVVLAGCNSGGGGSTSGTATGSGVALKVTATSGSMRVSASDTARSTQVINAEVLGSDGTAVADGTSVTFTADAGGFLAADGTTVNGTASATTSGGRASANYVAPTSAASVRLGANSLGGFAWVMVTVWK